MDNNESANVGSNILPTKRPTVIRPASKSTAQVNVNEQVNNNVTSVSQAPPSRPPPPATRLPKCPPKPENRQRSSDSFSVEGQTNKKKLEITVVDARPMSEVAFSDLKGYTHMNVTPQASVNRNSVIKQQSQDSAEITARNNNPVPPVKPTPAKVKESQGLCLDAELSDGTLHDERIRPGSVKSTKPTIIRPHSQVQPTGGVPPAAQVPGETAHPAPSPKPRLRACKAATPEAQNVTNTSNKENVLRSPPARPLSTPRWDQLSKGPISGDGSVHGERYPVSSELVSAEASVASDPATAKHLTSSAAPARPQGPPSVDSRGSKAGNDLSARSTEPQSGIIKPSTQARLGGEHEDEAQIQPVKPKPKPKPRPVSATIAASKEVKDIAAVANEDKGVKRQPSVLSAPPEPAISTDCVKNQLKKSTEDKLDMSSEAKSNPHQPSEVLTKKTPTAAGKIAMTKFKEEETIRLREDNVEDLKCVTSVAVDPSHRAKPESSQPSKPAHSKTQFRAAEPPALPTRPGPGHPLYSYMSMQPHAIALHDYAASQPDELPLSEGDVVVLLKEISDQWMTGRVGSREGMFPKAFIQIKCPLGGEKFKPSESGSAHSDGKNKLSGPRCRARFDFEGENENELSLEEGQVVQILERVGTDWLRGEHRGRQGIFPTSFVEIIEDFSSVGNMDSSLVTAVHDFDGELALMKSQAGDRVIQMNKDSDESKGQTGAAIQASDVPSGYHSPQAGPKPEQEQDKLIQGHKVEFWQSKEAAISFCRAMSDYSESSPGYLKFKMGERIEILEFLGEDWARGRLAGKEGMVPLGLLAEEVNSPPPSPEPQVEQKKVLGQVLHDFDGETVDDLIIKEGDLIEVEDFADINKNWRWGTLNGKRGMFPVAFVQILD